MKAIVVRQFGGPEVLRLEEVPDPVAAPSQIVVRLAAVGINPFDTYIRAGEYARLPPLPYTPGRDGAGVVQAVGDKVKTIKPGERVYVYGTISGAYAELALCEPAQVHRLPDKVTFAQGAGVGVPYSTAYRALVQRAQAIAGETLLVHGASGGVGVAAVQLARSLGLTTIGTAGSERGLRLVLEQGAHHALNHHAADYLDELRGLFCGRGVDIILEMAAHINLNRDLTAIAPRGRIVVIGSRGGLEMDPRRAMGMDASILGMTLFNLTAEETASIHAGLGAGLENGSLRPVIGQELELSQAAQAHQAVMERGAHGKIVLLP